MDKKYQKTAEILRKYMDIEAISRYEEPVVKELIKSTNNKQFTYSRDALGSLIIHKASKNSNAPKVMIAAHMDEVGYLVRSIDKNGQILVSTVGGVWPSVVIGTKAKLVTNRDKKTFIGIFGHTSIHIMTPENIKNATKANELFVDFGFSSDKEVEEAGIEIGDPIYMYGEYVELANNLVAGKAMDNRAGVTALQLIANHVADLELDVDLYLVGTVQEEVGTRGAKTSVSLINPDLAIALDTGASHDTLNCIPGVPKLGNGAALLVKDTGTMMDPKLMEVLMKYAQNNKIKAYKYVAEGGGTDASALQYAQGGAATITVSIPQRYLHSPLGVCSLIDIDAAANLLIKFISSFNQKDYENIKYN